MFYKRAYHTLRVANVLPSDRVLAVTRLAAVAFGIQDN